MSSAAIVNVRDLRQNLSKYLRRVAGGETLQVGDHGRPVALLTPLPEAADPYERLIAEGKIIPAQRKLSDLGPAPQIKLEVPLSRLLEIDRSEGEG